MADIYQELWDIDQEFAGVRAVKLDTPITNALKAHGYVKVDERRTARQDTEVLAEVHIPDSKMESYNRVIKLFDNYTLDQTKPEYNTVEEREEVRTFLNYLVETPPLRRAQKFVSDGLGREITANEWWTILYQVWFEQYTMGHNPNLSGFEHVVVGEQQGGKVQGYHFWYKYHLDEHFRYTASGGEVQEYDAIKFMNWKNRTDDDTPDSVTLGYQWQAFDYEAKKFRPLTKPMGGFFVGPSIAGLIAMGIVRFLSEAGAPRLAAINGYSYNLRVYPGSSPKNMRTFYPEMIGRA